MRSAITVSLVPETKSGPFVFSEGLADACAQAGELGFDAVEIFPPAAAALEPRTLTALLERHHLAVAAVGTGAGWVVRKLSLTHGDPAIRAQAKGFVRTIIDAAGQFRAPAIIGSMQGRWDADTSRDQALRYLAEALGELGDDAARHGVPLLYEPLNRYETNLFNRLGDTAAWLRSLPVKNVRLLADLFHMNIEEASTAQALREAGELVGHVHFADSNRRAIGMGQTVVEPIIAALQAVRFDGYLSAEIFPLPDPLAAAKQTIAAFRRYAPHR